MRNKFIKAMLVSFLCLIIFAGCSVVPSLTPETTPTPTSAEPTQTPIPYGEVLVLNYFIQRDTVSPVVQYQEILLERFSVKLNRASFLEDADIVFNVYGYDTSEFFAKDKKGIKLDDFVMSNIDKMPYCQALFDMNIYHAWMYNREWFENYGYNIPKTMDELISLLSEHKKAHPNDKLILEHKKKGESAVNDYGFGKTEVAMGLTYGIDLTKELTKEERESETYSMLIRNIEALRKNNLVSRVSIDKDTNIDEYAVLYTGACNDAYKPYVSMDVFHPTIGYMCRANWNVFENQLSQDKIYVSPLLFAKEKIIADNKQQVYLRDNDNVKLLERMVDYFDWCCTPEGVLKSFFGDEGKNYSFGENGLISQIPPSYAGRTWMDTAINVIDKQFAYRIIFGMFFDENVTEISGFYYSRYFWKVEKALRDKQLSVIKVTSY